MLVATGESVWNQWDGLTVGQSLDKAASLAADGEKGAQH